MILFLALLIPACGAVLPPPRERIQDLPSLPQGAAKKKTSQMLSYGHGILQSLKMRPSNERLEKLEEAETAFLTARHYSPENPAVHLALGRLYEIDGHLEAALASYRKVLAFSALDPEALLHAAQLATDMGREREAARYLVALRTLPGMIPKILILEARVFLVLAKARDQNPQSRHTYLDNAQRAFSKLQEIAPKDPRGPGGLAHCLILKALGNKQKAPSTLRARINKLLLKAARLAPDDPLPRYNLARYLESPAVSDLEAAKIAYRSALRRDPKHLPSLLNLASLELQSGRKKEAQALYQRALPLIEDPAERDWVLAFLTNK
jgi:tetratricopeptide (TPR) repeat protein